MLTVLIYMRLVTLYSRVHSCSLCSIVGLIHNTVYMYVEHMCLPHTCVHVHVSIHVHVLLCACVQAV